MRKRITTCRHIKRENLEDNIIHGKSWRTNRYDDKIIIINPAALVHWLSARIPVRWRKRLIDNPKRRKFLWVRFPFISCSFHVVVLGLLRRWMEFGCWNKKAIFKYFITKIVVNNEWIALTTVRSFSLPVHSLPSWIFSDSAWRNKRWFLPAASCSARGTRERKIFFLGKENVIYVTSGGAFSSPRRRFL